MDVRTWPLSAAATQLLVDLQPGRPPSTERKIISRLVVKELVLRGRLKVTQLRPGSFWGAATISLAVVEVPAGGPELPAPLELLMQHLPATGPEGRPLVKLLKEATKSDAFLFRQGLRHAALRELDRHGLTAPGERRILFFTQRFQVASDAGRGAADAASAAVERVRSLNALAARDPDAALREAEALGFLLLLLPVGVPLAARLSEQRRAGLRDEPWSRRTILTAIDEAFADQEFDDQFDAIDEAVRAIDAAIDSGVDSGGGGGGDGGGGD